MAKKPTPTNTLVKEHRYDFPLEKIGEKKRRVVKIMLNESGYFLMEYPKEVQDMFFKGQDKPGYAWSQNMQSAISDFERKITQYKDTLQSAKREKVIVVKFLYNKPYTTGHGHTAQLTRGDHGHWNEGAGRYALAVDYEVMWRIGNALWDVAIDDRDGSIFGPPQHRYSLPMADRAYNVLDWTEEREQFLSNMTYSLEDLIGRLRGFFGKNLLANMTLAIENGGGLTALPAPETTA